jgi:hypothetical protein
MLDESDRAVGTRGKGVGGYGVDSSGSEYGLIAGTVVDFLNFVKGKGFLISSTTINF